MKKYISLVLISLLLLSQTANIFAVEDTINNTPVSSSGTTSSGGMEILSADTTPKLSDMKYYEGTFTLNGQSYGNSFYDNSMDFSKADLSKVKIMTYDEYMQKSGANQSFQVLSAPTDGLVGSWDLNGNALDTSGNGINGTSSNVLWEKSVGVNQVGVFNGANSQVFSTLASGYSKTTGNTMSVSAWVKWDTSAGYQDVMTMRGASGFNWIFYRHADNGAISFHGGNSQNKGSYVLPTNQWVFVTATVDANGVSKVYADTKEVYSTTGYYYGTPQSQLTIGSAAGMGEWFKGRLGLLKIYNKVLSADEINALYQEGQEKILGIIPTPVNKVTTVNFAGLTITVTETAAMYKTEVVIGGFKIYFGIEKV